MESLFAVILLCVVIWFVLKLFGVGLKITWWIIKIIIAFWLIKLIFAFLFGAVLFL